MITVSWPSTTAEFAEVWRVLDLSGLTKSVRQSKGYLKAGFVYLNGHPVTSTKAQVKIGSVFELELRFPSTKTITKTILLRNRLYATMRKPRSNEPTTINRRG